MLCSCFFDQNKLEYMCQFRNHSQLAMYSCHLLNWSLLTLPMPDLNTNSTCYWQMRTSNTKDLLVLQNIYCSYKLNFNSIRKMLHTIHRKHIFSFILSSFISKISGHIFEEKPVLNNCPQMLGPFEVFFTGLRQWFTVSIEP